MTSKHNKQARYRLVRKRYRAQEERCVLKIRTCATEEQEREIAGIFRRTHLAKNELRVFARKRLDEARKTRKWRRARKAYHDAAEHMKKVKKGGETWKACDGQRKAAAERCDEVLAGYGVTKEALAGKAKELAKKYGIPTVIAQTMAEDVWSAVASNIYRGGKRLYLRPWYEDDTIRAKQHDRCIMLKNDDRHPDVDGAKRKHPYISFNGMAFPLDIRDRFEMDMLESALEWMDDSEAIEKRDVRRWLRTGEVRDSHRPCYVSLQLEHKKNKDVLWAVITLAGRPSPKKDALGLPRHVLGKGRIGDDLGVASNHYCFRNTETGTIELRGANTAVYDAKAQERNDKRIKRNQKAMDRSIRAMNPAAFAADGTYKPGVKCRRRSKRWQELKQENRLLHRNNAVMRDNAVRRHANEVRACGDRLVIEDNSPAAWAKRAAPAKNPDGSIDKASNRKRKRLGKGVGQGCPGAVQASLKAKFGEENVLVVSRRYRASQYNPVADEYVKHELSERSWLLVEDDPGTWVLRDGFAAFALYCSDDDGGKPDRRRMLALLGEYFDAQGAYIARQRESGAYIRNSGVSPP